MFYSIFIVYFINKTLWFWFDLISSYFTFQSWSLSASAFVYLFIFFFSLYLSVSHFYLLMPALAATVNIHNISINTLYNANSFHLSSYKLKKLPYICCVSRFCAVVCVQHLHSIACLFRGHIRKTMAGKRACKHHHKCCNISKCLKSICFIIDTYNLTQFWLLIGEI